MGIKNETFKKIKNLEPLTQEERKEMLEDTQRAGFDPSIHQVRSSLDLMDTIERFNKQSSEQTGKMIELTKVIIYLTVAMLVGLVLQVWFVVKQTNYTEIQSRSERINQARITQDVIKHCEQSPELQESGLFYIESGNPAPCAEVLRQYKTNKPIQY